MIPFILIIFLFFTGGVSILAAAGQLFVLNRRKENINLFVLFLCLGLLLIQHAAFFTGHVPAATVIMSFHISLLYLFGPLLFMAYFIVAYPDVEFPKKMIRCFLPALFSLVPDIFFIFQTRVWKISLINDFHLNNNSSQVLILKILLAGACLQIIIYLVFLLIKILSVWEETEINSIMNITIIYILSSIIAAMVLMAGYILSSFVLFTISSLLTGLCLIFAYLLGQRYPGFLQLLKTEVKDRQYKRSLLEGIDTESICENLTALMEKEKVFADEEITLKRLAEKMDISSHQLSQLLNEKLSVNFYTFINRYRIQEARRILIEEPDRSIITIAFAIGFNSKSSFYEAFSKFTGKTPYRYRKDILAEN